MTITQNIKCARCRWSLRGPPKPKPHDRLTCPRCGNGDTLKNIMAEARRYVEEQEAHEYYSQLVKAGRSSQHLEVIEKSAANRTFRFIVVRRG